MVAFHTFGPFTGVGQEYFTDPSNPTEVRLAYAISDPGNAWPLDADDPHRLIRLGWIALFDNYPSGTDPEIADYMHQPVFLEWNHGWLEAVFLNDCTTGTSGFNYNLQPGVEATFWWYY